VQIIHLELSCPAAVAEQNKKYFQNFQ